jgi:hypothetical protein
LLPKPESRDPFFIRNIMKLIVVFDMNVRWKKIVARECLVFFSLVGIVLLTYIVILVFNHFKSNEVSRLEVETHLKRVAADSVVQNVWQKNETQNEFTKSYVRYFKLSKEEFTNSKVWNQFYKVARADSMAYKWENEYKDWAVPFLKKQGFNSPDEFQSFILKNILNTKDINDNRLAIKLYAERDSLQSKLDTARKKIVTTNGLTRTIWITVAISFFVLFVIRYIYYAIKWSIKTLKQPNQV